LVVCDVEIGDAVVIGLGVGDVVDEGAGGVETVSSLAGC
jgi:hypothetical protein